MRGVVVWCVRERSRDGGRAAHLLARAVLAHHVLRERHVGRAARLQRDGVRAEVLQHVVHVGEPQVLHAALPRHAQRHAQVLRATLHRPTLLLCNSCISYGRSDWSIGFSDHNDTTFRY